MNRLTRALRAVFRKPVPFHERMRLAREYGAKVASGEMSEHQARATLRRLRVM